MASLLGRVVRPICEKIPPHLPQHHPSLGAHVCHGGARLRRFSREISPSTQFFAFLRAGCLPMEGALYAKRPGPPAYTPEGPERTQVVILRHGGVGTQTSKPPPQPMGRKQESSREEGN